jgi:SAM-dependent methyltransferase
VSRRRGRSRIAPLAQRLAASGPGRALVERLGSALGPGNLESWLAHYYGQELERLDARCAELGDGALPDFRHLDDDLWTVLLSREYARYEHIRDALPRFPEPKLQLRWNGAAGLRLLARSQPFYVKVREIQRRHGSGDLGSSSVLDFGCGWGRLTRFFARDVAPGALYGCDPSTEILDVCRRTRVPAHLARSDFVPQRLPFDASFDLVFAFSVFTHLSEEAHRRALEAIHAALAPGGLLVVTVRPPAYLELNPHLQPLLAELRPDPVAALEAPHYVFAPHVADPTHPQYAGSQMHYGEAVISLAYVRERWDDLFELLEVGLLAGELHQVVLALRRR